MSNYPDIRLIENRFMCDPVIKQTFIPRSKKRRIQKKAKKLYTKCMGYRPWERIMFGGDFIIGHPDIIAKIKKELSEANDSTPLRGVSGGILDEY